ncbi:hypothetical protein [Streptomyces tendae]
MSGQEPSEAGRDDDLTPVRETLIATERALAQALTPHVDVESALAALMRRTTAMPTDAQLMQELRALRRSGLARLRTHSYPTLSAAALASGFSTELDQSQGIETLLREAVRRLGQDTSLGQAAAHSFGLLPGRRDAPSISRRMNAAMVYGVSTERFRKSEESLVIGRLAEAILAVLHESPRTPGATTSQQRDQHEEDAGQLLTGELGPSRNGGGGRP